MFYGFARGSSSKLYLTLNHYPIRTSPRFLNPFFHQSVHAKENLWRQKRTNFSPFGETVPFMQRVKQCRRGPLPFLHDGFPQQGFNSKKYFIFVLQYFLLCEWAFNCIAAFFLFSADLDLVHAPSLLKKRSQYLDFYNFYKWILQIGFVLHCLTSCRTWKSSQDENVSISNSRWLWKLLYPYVYTYIHIAKVTSCGTWKSPQDENVSTSSWSASRLCTWKKNIFMN